MALRLYIWSETHIQSPMSSPDPRCGNFGSIRRGQMRRALSVNRSAMNVAPRLVWPMTTVLRLLCYCWYSQLYTGMISALKILCALHLEVVQFGLFKLPGTASYGHTVPKRFSLVLGLLPIMLIEHLMSNAEASQAEQTVSVPDTSSHPQTQLLEKLHPLTVIHYYSPWLCLCSASHPAMYLTCIAVMHT